jgi:hypothetical protein
MDNVEKLTAIEDIKALKARYFLALDGKDAAAYADKFGNDGIFDIRRFDITGIEAGRIQPGPVLTGGRVIADFVLGALAGIQSSHRAFNPFIEILSPTEARATWAMEDWLRGSDGQIRLAGFGYYHDRYGRNDVGWTIAYSELVRWT